MPRQNLNFIDLFSGAGGFSCGLEMSGHQCLLGVDFNRSAVDTFALNHPTAASYCGDISLLTKKKLNDLLKGQKVDLVVGGPPCQGFSTVGKGNPKDQRNSLFKQFLRVIDTVSPEFFLMENVTGLLAKKNEPVLKSILSEFKKRGFQVVVSVLSAQEYGVPERRRRTIFLGRKGKKYVDFPPPTHDGAQKPYNR